MKKPTHQTVFKIISALGFIGSVILCVCGWKSGILTSQEKMQTFIDGFGIAGVIVFMLFLAVQVVFPVFPGGVGCLAGVLMFGPWKGLIYNYIGICTGSMLAFAVSKYYGRPALNYFFSEKQISKYDKWNAKNDRFTKLFAIGIFLPVAPDNYLCYLAGTTEMEFPTFALIIIFGKAFATSIYSLGLAAIWQQIINFAVGG